MTGRDTGHNMLSKKENRHIKGSCCVSHFVTLLKYHSCVLRCMALHSNACKVKDMCLRDRKVGYKGSKDTSQTFSCYFASECTRVISLIIGLTKKIRNKIVEHAYVIQSYFPFLLPQLKYKVPLRVNK